MTAMHRHNKYNRCICIHLFIFMEVTIGVDRISQTFCSGELKRKMKTVWHPPLSAATHSIEVYVYQASTNAFNSPRWCCTYTVAINPAYICLLGIRMPGLLVSCTHFWFSSLRSQGHHPSLDVYCCSARVHWLSFPPWVALWLEAQEICYSPL